MCVCVCTCRVYARVCVCTCRVCARSCMRACVRARVCMCVQTLCISSYMVIIKSYKTNMPKYPSHLNTMQFLHKTRHVAQGRVKSGQPLPSVVKRKRTEDANSPETECANIFISMLFVCLFVGGSIHIRFDIELLRTQPCWYVLYRTRTEEGWLVT